MSSPVAADGAGEVSALLPLTAELLASTVDGVRTNGSPKNIHTTDSDLFVPRA